MKGKIKQWWQGIKDAHHANYEKKRLSVLSNEAIGAIYVSDFRNEDNETSVGIFVKGVLVQEIPVDDTIKEKINELRGYYIDSNL